MPKKKEKQKSPAAVALGKKSAEALKKKLGKKKFNEHMKSLRHNQIAKKWPPNKKYL